MQNLVIVAGPTTIALSPRTSSWRSRLDYSGYYYSFIETLLLLLLLCVTCNVHIDCHQLDAMNIPDMGLEMSNALIMTGIVVFELRNKRGLVWVIVG
jgi:hypothetical protein